MLGKLLKQEFVATTRVMGPLCLVVLALAVCANFSARILDFSNSTVLSILAGLVMMAFGFAIIGVCIMSVVLMINRFRTNLMGDEGYVMFTLPVNSHQLVCSKIMVSTTWFIGTGIVCILAGMIAAFRVDFITQIFSDIRDILAQFSTYYALNGIAILVETLILVLLACAACCLIFYAALAVGHSFANHKNLLSVLFFFGFQFVSQIIGTIAIAAVGDMDFNLWQTMSNMEMTHLMMGVGILVTLIYSAIFYLVNTFMLEKRLNLE
ncbi:MAG: hypothetical protein RR053_04145 [Evtepia sp.]